MSKRNEAIKKGYDTMKKIVKTLALILCAVLLVSLASCVKDAPEDIPAGMKLATAAGADFRLYIPTSWNTNTAYGVSGGYYSMKTQSSVSMTKYPITEEMQSRMTEASVGEDGAARIAWFWENECKTVLEKQSLGGSFSEAEAKSEDLINGINAWRFHCKGIVNGKDLHYLQIIAERENAFYVFSFVADASVYTDLLPNVESMLDVFVFADPYVPDDYVKDLDADVEVPAGMKLASSNDVAYYFFVPEGWTVNRDEEIYAAYLESDRSSVSVVPYMPDADSMSVAAFFTMCQDMMKNNVGEDGYELISYQTVDLGGRQATEYVYRYTVGGVEYRYKQVIAAYKSMIYSVTYTALPENFDAHLADVDAMIGAFRFR